MDTVLSDKLVQARKHYECEACYWWNRSGYTIDDCENADQRLVVEAAEADGWRILPGQMYRRITGVFEGSMCTYRARPGMQSVIQQLDLCDD